MRETLKLNGFAEEHLLILRSRSCTAKVPERVPKVVEVSSARGDRETTETVQRMLVVHRVFQVVRVSRAV